MFIRFLSNSVLKSTLWVPNFSLIKVYMHLCFMADIAKCARAVEKRKIVTLAACISKMAVMIFLKINLVCRIPLLASSSKGNLF